MPDYKLRIIVEGEDRASGPLGKASGALDNILQIAGGNLLARGIEGGARALVGMGAGVNALVTGSADLTAQIDFIGATAGATSGEVDQLGQLISDLGVDPALKVDALGAADAVELLVRNGMPLEEIMNGGARGTVLLANATKADFGVAADIATDAMAQFNIEGENFGMIANQISGVLSNSKFDINDYALALSQSGGIAHSAGLEYDDYNAILATTAYMFASGSDAGTSLKTFLQQLTPGTNAASDTMRRLGLYTGLTTKEFEAAEDKMGKLKKKLEGVDPKSATFRKVTAEIAELKATMQSGDSVFFDQYGNMEDAATIADALANSMANLSEEQRGEALETLFGTDGSRIAIALLEQRGIKITELKDAIGDVDAEERAAAAMDNLAGDMEIFDGVVDTLKQNIGAELEPTWRVAFQSMTGLVTRFSPAVVGMASSLAGALAPAIEGWATSIESGLSAAFAAFDAVGGGAAGAVAGIFAGLGGTVSIDADAEITTINWGDFTYTYDATSDILSVAWGDWGFVYDAAAGIATVDWNGDGVPDFTYDAEAGITTIDWLGLLIGAGAGQGYTYDAAAGITTVDWNFGIEGQGVAFTYDAAAGITAIDWNMGGLITYTYDASAQISESGVLWGAYTHTYDGFLNVTEVAWGVYTHTYSGSSDIKNVAWGAWTHSYNADAKIERSSVAWGAFSHVYDAEANITTVTTPVGQVEIEGRFKVTSFLNAASEDLAGNLNSMAENWTWPELPEFTWPDYTAWQWTTYPTWTWPAYIAWTWPEYAKWTWVAYPTWTWPSIPTPSWLNSLLNWRPPSIGGLFGGGGGDATAPASSTPAPSSGSRGRALGGRLRAGLTTVGEFGPELLDLDTMRIFSNYESRQMVGAAAGAGGVQIVMHNTINNQGDEVRLARRVADIINGRAR